MYSALLAHCYLVTVQHNPIQLSLRRQRSTEDAESIGIPCDVRRIVGHDTFHGVTLITLIWRCTGSTFRYFFELVIQPYYRISIDGIVGCQIFPCAKLADYPVIYLHSGLGSCALLCLIPLLHTCIRGPGISSVCIFHIHNQVFYGSRYRSEQGSPGNRICIFYLPIIPVFHCSGPGAVVDLQRFHCDHMAVAVKGTCEGTPSRCPDVYGQVLFQAEGLILRPFCGISQGL